MAPFKLIKPDPASVTPVGHLRVLVVGSGTSDSDSMFSYEEWPHFPAGQAFPMSFLCRNTYEVKLLQPLCPFLRRIRNLDATQQIAAINHLSTRPATEVLLTREWSHYPVLKGNDGRELIATRWADVYKFFKGQQDPTLKSCSSLAKAIKYMIARGKDLEATANRNAKFEDFTERISSLDLDTEQPQTPSRNAAPSISGIHISPYRTSSTHSLRPSGLHDGYTSLSKQASTPTRWKAAHASRSASVVEVPDEDEEIPQVSSKSKVRDKGKGKSKSKERSGARAAAMNVDQDGWDAAVAGGDARGSREGAAGSLGTKGGVGFLWHVPVDANASPLIYMNIRNTQGDITSSTLTPPTVLRGERVQSLGPTIDEFTDCWGLLNATILNLYSARVRSTTEDQFICSLAPSISLQEGKWFWKMIRLPVNHATCVRNYARD
ncbi:hypothetical protein BC835DRAFT_1420229 [Cytidiella melzeri]|nr:hypothetical protein BC835DRAFT_1420229 [Cytidiella melzeri]